MIRLAISAIESSACDGLIIPQVETDSLDFPRGQLKLCLLKFAESFRPRKVENLTHLKLLRFLRESPM